MRILILLIAFSIGAKVHAGNLQFFGIVGPSNGQTGQQSTYLYDDGFLYCGANWTVTQGFIVSQSISGTEYSVTIEWTSSGTGQITFADVCTGGLLATRNVTISGTCTTPAMPNTTFTVGSNTCGPVSIQRAGTPPVGATWFWQTSSGGTSIANGGTSYNATSTQTYFLRAKANCGDYWSAAQQTQLVTVNQLPAVPPSPASSTNQCGPKILTLATSAPAGVEWYWQGASQNGTSKANPASPSQQFTASIEGAQNYYLAAHNPSTLCWSYRQISVNVKMNCDNEMNWSSSKIYGLNPDGSEKVVSSSRQYADVFGNPIQSQSKLFSVNKIFATESILDANGLPSLSTLPAPTINSDFAYVDQFVLNPANGKYAASNFDIGAKVENPDPVRNDRPGTLGWYYSSQNNLEPYTPTTDFPYARSWSEKGPDPKLSKSAGPGASYRMGSGHEVVSEKQIYQPSELSHYYSLRPYFLVTPNATLGAQVQCANNVTKSVNGQYKVFSLNNPATPGTFLTDGPITVQPGKAYQLSVKGYKSAVSDAKLFIANSNGQVIYYGPSLPLSANESWVNLDFVPPPDLTSIKVGVMWTESTIHISGVKVKASPLQTSIYASGSPGYKVITTDADDKQTISFVDAEGRTLASAVNTSTNPNAPVYDYWSYTYYNDIGQVIATVAPKGVVTANSNYPSFVTTYRYDHKGSLIETTNSDEGTTQFVYNTDGQIRFSQNQEQRNANPKRFSYTNYDEFGRVVEAGEYTESNGGGTIFRFEPHSVTTPSSNSVLGILDNDVKDIPNIGNYVGVSELIDPLRCSEHSFVYYDEADVDFIPYTSHTAQKNLLGQISKTENENSVTWYSYDEFGELSWSVQILLGLGTAAMDYTYDYLGNVTKVKYEGGGNPAGPDVFYHHYKYDEDQRLIEVYTNRSATYSSGDLRAKYAYYLHGPLKRIELGGNKQGLDFVYTLQGGLKSINHGDPAKDPGLDGIGGSSIAKDVFGMTMHYNAADYTGANANLGALTMQPNPSNYPDKFGGALKAITYHSPVDNNLKKGVGFQYDAVNQLTNSEWGSVSGTSSYTANLTTNYQEQIIGAPPYDKNGNIGALQRRDQAGNLQENFVYVYEPGTNRLDKVTENGVTKIDYTYNVLGQMIQQTEGANTMKVSYNAYGLVKEVRDGGNLLMQKYFYSDRGDLMKKTRYKSGNPELNTFYVNDASGNTIAIYEQTIGENAFALLQELPVYGTGRVAIYKPTIPAYLYEVSDHLGNVRAVINAPETIEVLASMEQDKRPDEQYQFLRYDNVRKVNATIFNHTPAYSGNPAPAVSFRLSGVADEKIGLARSLYVSPGDVVELKVFAKYADPVQSNWTTAFANLIAQVQSGAAGVVVDGTSYPTNDAYQFPYTGLLSYEADSGPKAYLNYLFFNSSFQYVDEKSGYVSVTQAAKINSTTSSTQHEELFAQLNITEPGYIYVYLSNENPTPIEVYFDDFSVKHIQSPVVGGADYYPFGLVMEGREIKDEPYRYGYQGQFSEKDLTTGQQEFQLRNYDARVGRWLTPDPYGQFASPYVGMGNIPHQGTDPDGGWLINLSSITISAMSYATMGTIASSAASVASFATMCCLGDFKFKNGGSYIGPSEYSSDQAVYNHSMESRNLPTSKPINTNALSEGIANYKPNITAHLSAYHPNFFEKMNAAAAMMSGPGSMGWSVVYDAINGVNLASYFFTPWRGEARNLDNTVATQKERVMGFASTAAAFLPFTTSSKSLAPSRTYTIYDAQGDLYKFGVTDAGFARMMQSLAEAGAGAWARYSSIMPKFEAHIMEKYLRSLHFHSTGTWRILGMRIPYPRSFVTGKPIKR